MLEPIYAAVEEGIRDSRLYPTNRERCRVGDMTSKDWDSFHRKEAVWSNGAEPAWVDAPDERGREARDERPRCKSAGCGNTPQKGRLYCRSCQGNANRRQVSKERAKLAAPDQIRSLSELTGISEEALHLLNLRADQVEEATRRLRKGKPANLSAHVVRRRAKP